VVKDRRRTIMIALSLAALAAAGLIARPYLRAAPGPATEFSMVCVATGEVFTRSIEEAPMIPAAHPRTGAYTLVPCVVEADGSLRVPERYAAALAGDLAAVNRVVDGETLLVKKLP